MNHPKSPSQLYDPWVATSEEIVFMSAGSDELTAWATLSVIALATWAAFDKSDAMAGDVASHDSVASWSGPRGERRNGGRERLEAKGEADLTSFIVKQGKREDAMAGRVLFKAPGSSTSL